MIEERGPEPTAFSGYQIEIYNAFTALSDYIWKLPKFIEEEKKLERKKLWNIFPRQDDPELERQASDLRKIRFYIEFSNLIIRFPHFMASSNLFLVCSVFEYYLLQLAKALEGATGASLADQRGLGVSRLFAYFRRNGIAQDDLHYFEQVVAAVKIRNCVLHADGLLHLTREEVAIRRLVREKLYIDEERRSEHDESDEFWMIRIVPGELGEVLRASNMYSFRLSFFAREFLLALCDRMAERVLA